MKHTFNWLLAAVCLVESEFVKSAILRSSVVVEEGGYLYVYPW